MSVFPSDVTSAMFDATTAADDPNHVERRFIVEMVIIVVSVLANGAGLYVAMRTHSVNRSVYHILYTNVSVSNIVACLLTWFCGNLPFFFREWFRENLEGGYDAHAHCQALAYKGNALVVALSVSVQMNIAMLSLAVVQYYAICRPLACHYVMQKRRAYALIAAGITAFLVCACVPFSVMMDMVRRRECDPELRGDLERTVKISANVFATLIVLLYAMMIAVGARIYAQLRQYTKKTRQNSRRKSVNITEKKLNYDKRAYTATVFLLLSRTLFTIPLTVYFVYNINTHGFAPNLYLHYFTVVPCAKCILDPLIYGSLMKDVRKTWRRVMACCCGGAADDADISKLTSSSRSEYSTSSSLSGFGKSGSGGGGGGSVYDRYRSGDAAPSTDEKNNRV